MSTQQWRTTTKQRMVDSMGAKCACCGYNKCISALDFHHLDASRKEFNLSAAMVAPKAWTKLVEELRKCILLCANCHRELHAGLITVNSKQYFNEAYAEYKEEQIKDPCPICGTLKPIGYITCSRKCAGLKAGKIDWVKTDVYELITLHGNAEQAGIALGISGSAVRKRLKKLSNMT